MLRAEKDQFIQKMRSDIDRAAGAIFLDFTGLTVNEVNDLRKKLRAGGIQYQVVKNSLMKRVVAGTTYEGVGKFLKGTPTGVVLGFEDPVSSAKVTLEFLKDCEHLKVKAGVVDKKPITAKETEALSKMPGKRELLATIIAQFMSPGRKIQSQLKSQEGRLVGAIDKKAEGAEKAAG